ncbi:MAG: cysteine desulfurase [Thermoguttaceae bacterium]|jgi:cysteine desulfurase|nr:cysteine desulfurase [Thermoguttaceae bacterium]
MASRQTPIYMDNHATTRVDPRVVEAMLPFFTEEYGNPASVTHCLGWVAKEAVETSRAVIASAIGARANEIVFTSGATESNNLAIRGVALRMAGRGKHLISVATEHPSVLDPLARLARQGYQVTILPVIPSPSPQAGCIQPEQVANALRDDTILVSVMLANNEIGAIHPLEEIGGICRQRGVLLHTDATQALGKIPVDVDRLGVDLMSLSAHKIHGPKGIGALFVRRRVPRIRLEPLIDGGGHEEGLRSGTLNVPGIVGFAKAVELCLACLSEEPRRLRRLRDRLYEGLTASVPDVWLNGPSLGVPHWRLPGNLNLSFGNLDGQTLLMHLKEVALSSGSACTSAHPGASHVLKALGLDDDRIRGSLRFGLGRFNTVEEVDFVIARLTETASRLRSLAGSSHAAPPP